MIKLTFLREEDYWLVPVALLAIFFLGACFYSGVLMLRLLTAFVGISLLYFTTYIIRRGYNKTHAYIHVFICFALAVAGAYGFYLLTN